MAWSDNTWRPGTVRAWCRPEGGYRGILSDQVFEWTVFLAFEVSPDMDGWYGYEARWLRLAGGR